MRSTHTLIIMHIVAVFAIVACRTAKLLHQETVVACTPLGMAFASLVSHELGIPEHLQTDSDNNKVAQTESYDHSPEAHLMSFAMWLLSGAGNHHQLL